MSTNVQTAQADPKDLAGTRASLRKIWGIPIGLLIGGGVWTAAQPILWPIGFLWIGGACAANALRCRRVHCTIMGPSFLVFGVLALADAVGVLAAPWLGYASIATTVVAFAPEFAGFKYFRRTPA